MLVQKILFMSFDYILTDNLFVNFLTTNYPERQCVPLVTENIQKFLC